MLPWFSFWKHNKNFVSESCSTTAVMAMIKKCFVLLKSQKMIRSKIIYLNDEPDNVADEKDDDDSYQKSGRALAGRALSLDGSAAGRWNQKPNCCCSVWNFNLIIFYFLLIIYFN